MARGEEVGCVNLSEFDELVRALELPDDEVESLQEELDQLGVDLTDDCGRANVQPTSYRNDEVAGHHHRRPPAVPQRGAPLRRC